MSGARTVNYRKANTMWILDLMALGCPNERELLASHKFKVPAEKTQGTQKNPHSDYFSTYILPSSSGSFPLTSPRIF